MKTIRSLTDLGDFGINVLTGEADVTSTRFLCDLTRKGQDVITNALGMPAATPAHQPFADRWNAVDDHGVEAVGSVMLPAYGSDFWKHLALFALALDGAERIFMCQDKVLGVYAGDTGPLTRGSNEERQAVYKELGVVQIIDGWINPNGTPRCHEGKVGDRYRHTMTGRAR